MRALKVFLTAAGFASYFVSMIAVSALTTSVVHNALVTVR
jgi:hypothetical protein